METIKEVALYALITCLFLMCLSVSYSIVSRGEVIFRFTTSTADIASGTRIVKTGFDVGPYRVEVLERK